MNFRRLVIAIAFLSICIMVSRPMVDTDTWWHLRTGQWILDHRVLSESDCFSFTRYGEPYYYPAWLSEILMAGIFSLGGLPALNLFFGILILLAFICIFFTMEGDAFLTAAVLVLAAGASEVYWSLRPHLFTFLFGACFYYCLQAFLHKGKNVLWALPAVMVLWVNMHPGYPVGFILLGITTAGVGIRYLAGSPRRNPATGRQAVWLVGTTFACLVAAVINPHGIRIFAYPLETLSIHFLQQFILEWGSPDFHLFQAQLFLGLFLATWTAVAFSPKRLDIVDFFCLIAIGVMGFTANRHTYLLSIIAPAIIIRYGNPILRAMAPKWNPDHPVSRMESAVQYIILIGLSVAGALWIIPTYAQEMDTALRLQVPVEGAAVLAEYPDDDRMLNSYNWGAYLLWAEPSRPVFVDGRTDLYGEDILRQYLKIVYAQEGWRDIMESWDIRLVFLEPSQPIVEVLLLDGWTIAYRDSQAILLQVPGS